MRATAAAAGAVVLLLAGVRLALDPLALARLTLLGAVLGVLAVADVRERRIPNQVVLPAAAACAALSLADGVHTSASLLAGAVLVLLMLAVSLAWTASLGMGDVKLALLILCALDGATATALILTLELYALIAAMLLIRHGRTALGTSLPLAPIIAAGSLLALLT